MFKHLLYTPSEIAKSIGENSKRLRLSKNLSRETLSKRSGVPAPTIKRFEQDGKVSLDALLLIASALDVSEQVALLFKREAPNSLEELKNTKRQRGRL